MKHIAIVLTVLCVAAVANAAIIAQESFSYTAGQTLQGQGAADSQWAGSWSGPAVDPDLTIIAGGLSYNAGGVVIDGGATAVQMTDGTIEGANRESRSLAANPTDSELYIRFLMRGDTDAWARDDAFFAVTGVGTSRKDIAALGYGNAEADPNNFTGEVLVLRSNSFGVPISSGQTHLVVARLWVDPTVTVSPTTYNSMQVWIDPDLAGTTGLVGTSIATGSTVVGPGQIDGLVLSRAALDGTGDLVTFDEYVIGQSWGDVVVPEPATMALMSIGGLALIRRRK